MSTQAVRYEVTALPEDFQSDRHLWSDRYLWTLYVEYVRDKGWGINQGDQRWASDGDYDWDFQRYARWYETWEEAIMVAQELARTMKVTTRFGPMTAREAAERERNR